MKLPWRRPTDAEASDVDAGTTATEPESLPLTAQLREALMAVPHGVVVVDADGNTVLRNPLAERFHEARHTDVLVAQALQELLQAALVGSERQRDLELFGPPKQVLRIVAHPLRDGDRLLGAAAFVHDLSEARRIESVRRDFVANVSHELKTPIGALALLSETMAAENDPAVLHQLAERVLGEADRLGRIIDDLLDLSLIEAQEAPTRETVSVASLLHESAERVHAVAEAAGIPLRVVPAVGDFVITCDRSQVLSAITNLLDNAVKYSEEGQPIELSAEGDGEYVSIVVRDHGIGIPSRDLERIFERFYRVDRARSRTTGGIGLGLAIVRHVAQAHGGEVTVESREGEGSVFRIRLPLAAGPARDAGPASEVREAS